MIHQLFFAAVALACLGYAFRFGGWPERAAAAVMILGVALTLAVGRAFGDRFHSVEIGILLVDGAMFVAFLFIALRADRFWPIWMTGMQGVSVMAHGAMAASPELIPWAYAFAVAIWSYPMLLLLAAGTRRHRHRTRQADVLASWSAS